MLDGTFQAIAPDGWPTYYWSASGRIAPVESLRWAGAWNAYPGLAEPVWDWHHINAVEPDGDGFLVSLRHTDAIYRIRRGDGGIDWKLGGTHTPQSLKILGDWFAGSDFGGQHDVRASPTGRSPCSTTARVFTYRAVPVLPGELSRTALLAGMDAMHPRP